MAYGAVGAQAIHRNRLPVVSVFLTVSGICPQMVTAMPAGASLTARRQTGRHVPCTNHEALYGPNRCGDGCPVRPITGRPRRWIVSRRRRSGLPPLKRSLAAHSWKSVWPPSPPNINTGYVNTKPETTARSPTMSTARPLPVPIGPATVVLAPEGGGGPAPPAPRVPRPPGARSLPRAPASAHPAVVTANERSGRAECAERVAGVVDAHDPGLAGGLPVEI